MPFQLRLLVALLALLALLAARHLYRHQLQASAMRTQPLAPASAPMAGHFGSGHHGRIVVPQPH
ncbi:hypothetical protein [Hymenobacter sp. BT559]|uniref:hypothetical protein n=1 Tax=Hymenobacter sp. BT559 TaxID=2795729 RepID=UPI0018EB7EE9|nr:hypothetical protein [Hymenobacter sp. BT559]MBJ6144447.1 hypothetical protein [Hymenobacter sp. BT559]